MAQTLESGAAGRTLPEAPSGDALKIFVSYSRADMATADALVAALEAHGFAVTIDRRDLPYGEEWQAELSAFIASSDTVVWLVSPDSVKSKWVNWELGEVGRLSKRLLPVKVVDTDPATLPEALGRIHLLPAEGVYEPARHEADLVKALNTDRAWLKKATLLADDARQWVAANRDGAHLLRGRALAEAEAWSVSPPRDVPAPASEILELILASRRGQDRRRRVTVAGSVAAAIVAIALAATAVWFGLEARDQAAEADRQSEIAQAEQQRAESAAVAARAAQERAEAESRRAEQAATEANAARERAEAERAAALKAEVSRVAAVSTPYLDSGRPDVALALALDVAPRGLDSDVPLIPELEAIIRRAYLETPPPMARRLTSNAYSVAVSADGRFIAAGTAGDDEGKGYVHIYDPASMNELIRFKAMDDIVSGLDFSPDGGSIAVAGGTTPAVWDVATGEKKFDLQAPSIAGFSAHVRYSPDGTAVVLGTNGNVAYVFDGTTGRLRFRLPGMQFDDMLDRLAAAGVQPSDGIVEAVARNVWGMFGTATEVAVSPDGRYIAVTGPANPEGAVQIFDARTGALLKLLDGGTSSFYFVPSSFNTSTLSFSSDSTTVVASALPYTIKAWSATSGDLKAEFPARDVEAFVVSDDGRTLISAHANGNVAFRCLEGLLETFVMRAHDTMVTSVAISPLGLLMSTSEDRTAKLWRLPTSSEICASLETSVNGNAISLMSPLAVYSGHGAVVHKGAFTADSRAAITISQDGFLRFWPVDTSPAPIEVVEPFDFPPDPADRSELLLASRDGRTAFVKGRTYDEYAALDIETLKLEALADAVAVAPDGNQGAGLLFAAPHASWPHDGHKPALDDAARFSSWRGIVSRDGSRAIRDERDRRFLYRTGQKQDISELTAGGRRYGDFFFSADGSRLFGRGDAEDFDTGDALTMWDTASGEVLLDVESLEDFSISSFHDASADGTVLLVSTNDKTHLYRIGATLEPIRIEALDTGGVFEGNPLDLSSDGGTLVRGHPDGRLEVFDVAGGGVRTVRPTTSAVKHVLLDEGAATAIVVDIARTVTVFSLRDDRPLNSFRLRADAAALVLAAESGSLVVLDMLGRLNVFPLGTASDQLTDGADFVDWIRATRHSSFSADGRRAYGLREPNQETRPDLEAVTPFPVPPVRRNPSPNEKTSECDGLAANPYDRDRRAAGVGIEGIDATVALPVCQEALKSAPFDPQTNYQVGRVLERAGDLDAAMHHYLAAAAMDYAAGLRNVGRLIAVSPPGRFPKLGPARDWIRRGAKAGDPWALVTEAASLALEELPGPGFTKALSMLLSAGFESRSQAFMNLAFWIQERNPSDPEIRERALLSATIGLELYERVVGMTAMANPDILNNTLSLVRRSAADVDPSRMVAIYREALAWRAGE